MLGEVFAVSNVCLYRALQHHFNASDFYYMQEDASDRPGESKTHGTTLRGNVDLQQDLWRCLKSSQSNDASGWMHGNCRSRLLVTERL